MYRNYNIVIIKFQRGGKIGKIATNCKNTFITVFLCRDMLMNIVYWIK